MSGEILVDVKGLHKAYPRLRHAGDRLKALASLLVQGDGGETTPILKGIDLQVRRGESLGLMGENGAGKSTLLKIIAGVLAPTSGTVEVTGSMGALLELGAGFHPEYTGLENIKMACAMRGIPASEIKSLIPSIIEFADIGDYINEPVKHYSSGMVVRLGFAVIANMRPDLLITDEVLAVGDVSFQNKCIAWIEDYLAGGGTLLLVSHSVYHVTKLCQRACWINEGKVEMAGDVHAVTQSYLAHHERKDANKDVATERATGEVYRLLDMSLGQPEGQQVKEATTGDDLTVCGRVYSPDGRTPVVGVGIVRANGTAVYGTTTELDSVLLTAGADGHFHFALRFPHLPLLPGDYEVRAHAFDPEGVRLFDTMELVLRVGGTSREFGYCQLQHEWVQD